MSLNENKIAGLREHAKRGIGYEKENAINILNKLGIPIDEPKLPLGDAIKKTFGGDPVKQYRVRMDHSTDPLFMSKLVREVTGKMTIITLTSDLYIEFNCTAAQVKDIVAIFKKNSKDFFIKMSNECHKYVDDYLLKG